MNTTKAASFIGRQWDESIIPALCDYIRIPNKSPVFDPDWEKHGHMDRAIALLEAWCRKQPIRGMQIEIVRIKGRTPVLFIDIPGDSEEVVVLYGHFDKQPEFSGWSEGLDPWTPVIRNGKLYGRGGADDGYATFGSLTAIRALQEQGIPHAHCVVLIEGCEESGSFDLPYYIDLLKDRIGSPNLVVCLDAECGNYEQLWCTTSLRGNLTGKLKVEVLTEGVEIHESVAPLEGETVISKEHPNSFRETELESELRNAGIDELVVCGMMTSMCVDATVRAAVDLGFETTVVHDACATCELDFDGAAIPAASVHAAFLAALADGYAAVVSTDDIAG